MPVLPSLGKSCFGIDVDLGLSKELGSLGKLSEVCKKPRDAEGIVTKAAFMSEREAHKCMFCKDLTACCTGAS